MRLRASLLFSLIALLCQTGCLYIARYDGPYNGKVVDAETKEPIEGAVIVGVWNTETPTFGGATHQYFDIREVMTDCTGHFSIPGQGLRIMSTVLPANILIFKSGYNYVGEIPWSSIKTISHNHVQWDGEKMVISLVKLTSEDRKRHTSLPLTPSGPDYKMNLLIQEIDREREARGLMPISGGDK